MGQAPDGRRYECLHGHEVARVVGLLPHLMLDKRLVRIDDDASGLPRYGVPARSLRGADSLRVRGTGKRRKRRKVQSDDIAQLIATLGPVPRPMNLGEPRQGTQLALPVHVVVMCWSRSCHVRCEIDTLAD